MNCIRYEAYVHAIVGGNGFNPAGNSVIIDLLKPV